MAVAVPDIRLEYESDKLLSRWRGKEYGIYTEQDIRRIEFRERNFAERIAEDIENGIDVQWVDPNIVPEAEEKNITLAELELLAGLTRKQRQAVRLMKRHKKQRLVAAIMKVKPCAVSMLLKRAHEKIRIALDVMGDSIPSNAATQIFYDEIKYKQRLIYRRPVVRWVKQRRQGRPDTPML